MESTSTIPDKSDSLHVENHVDECNSRYGKNKIIDLNVEVCNLDDNPPLTRRQCIKKNQRRTYHNGSMRGTRMMKIAFP